MAAKGSIVLLGDSVTVIRRAEIVALLDGMGEQKAVAEYLGIDQSTLTRFIQKQGITKTGRWE